MTPEQYANEAFMRGDFKSVTALFRQAMQQARAEAMRDARATVALTLEDLLDSK